MSASPLTLYGLNICPFAQRAVITLLEKGVAFEQVLIDLDNKPASFKAISPLGNVPVLGVRQADGSEAAIFESLVIAEYLDETQPGPQLLPADPLLRAQHRAWLAYASSVVSGMVGIERAADEAAILASSEKLATRFARIEQELGEGPYFAGARFGMVDVVYAPIFRYFEVFESFRDLGIFNGLPKVNAWRQALAQRPSVRNAVTVAFHDELVQYLRKCQSHLVKAAH